MINFFIKNIVNNIFLKDDSDYNNEKTNFY